MGSGKSSFGRRLAARTGWKFIDTDVEIERRAGRSVTEIFAERGEEYFRELERQVIAEVTSPESAQVCADGGDFISRQSGTDVAPTTGSKPRHSTARTERQGGAAGAAGDPLSREIVALGGGAVCREGIMEGLNASGTTFYLNMPPARLVRRMSEQGRARRPKIAGMNDDQLLAYIRKALPEREKFYKMANFVVECGGRTDAQILEEILSKL